MFDDGRAAELANALLARHGIHDPGMASRLRGGWPQLHHSVFRGRDRIHPGPRFLASAHEIPDGQLEHEVEAHWSATLAGHYRALVIERDHGGATAAWHFMVPSVVKAIAEANAWAEGTLDDEGRPVEHRAHRGWEALRNAKRHETLKWFRHLKLRLEGAPIVAVDHRSVTLDSRWPESLLAAMPGRRLHEIVGAAGIAPGTPAGETVVRGTRGTRLFVDQAWEHASPPPTGADARWAALGLRAAFCMDDGASGLS